MKKILVTVEMEICQPDHLTEEEVLGDLQSLLKSDAAYRLLAEPRPVRSASDAGWWMQSAEIVGRSNA